MNQSDLRGIARQGDGFTGAQLGAEREITLEEFWLQWEDHKQGLRQAVEDQLHRQEQLAVCLVKRRWNSHRPPALMHVSTAWGQVENSSKLSPRINVVDDVEAPSRFDGHTHPALQESPTASKYIRRKGTLQSLSMASEIANTALRRCWDEEETKTPNELSRARTNTGRWSVPPQKSSLTPTLRRRLWDWWTSLEEPPRTGQVAQLVLENRNFDLTCAFVILLNSVFTGYTVNFEIQNLGKKPDPFMEVMELIFLSFYTVEMGLKIHVHRLYYFCNEDMSWNLFDFFLVLVSLIDQIAYYSGSGNSANMTFARSVRVFKLGKIFRMFRVMRFLRELRVMMLSIAGSFASLFWSFVMLAFICGMFSLIFVQRLTNYLMEGHPALHQVDGSGSTLYQKILAKFGSVELGCLSLYQTTTGGVDWEEVYNIIQKSGAVNSVIFIFYISFFNFAVLNILTGIFVENAMKLAAPDREELMMDQRRREEKDIDALRKLWATLDQERRKRDSQIGKLQNEEAGTLSLQELEEFLYETRTNSYLASLGIDIKDVKMFFKALSAVSGTNRLHIDDFVDHCLRMKGVATSIDLHGLAFETKLLKREFERYHVLYVKQHEQMLQYVKHISASTVSGCLASSPHVTDQRKLHPRSGSPQSGSFASSTHVAGEQRPHPLSTSPLSGAKAAWEQSPVAPFVPMHSQEDLHQQPSPLLGKAAMQSTLR